MTVVGLPLWLVGIGCLVIAAVYFAARPRPRRFTNGLPHFVLRWFHGLVWLFLAASCFIAPQAALGGTATATWVALLGLACYIIFMLTLFSDRLSKA